MRNRKSGPVEEEGFLSIIKYSGSSDLTYVIYNCFSKTNYGQFCESRAVFKEGHIWVHYTQSFKDLGHTCKFSPCLIGSEAVFHLLIPGHAWNGCNCHSIMGARISEASLLNVLLLILLFFLLLHLSFPLHLEIESHSVAQGCPWSHSNPLVLASQMLRLLIWATIPS